MKNDKSKNIIIGLLVVIIIILGTLVVLFATGTISFNNNLENNNNNNQENAENNKNEQEDNKKTELIEFTLPSNKIISINKEYENVFNNNEKIIVTSDGKFPYKDAEAYNSELTLTEFIEKELNEYPTEFYTGKKVLISNTLFDFDNDGINEIMFSFCEEYILLHYYNGKVYGYTLGGYRSNSGWRVNGTSRFSSSAIDGGINQYSFNGSKLIHNIIAISKGDYSNPTSTDIDVTYKVNDKIVNEMEHNKFVEEQNKISLIEFVDYS